MDELPIDFQRDFVEIMKEAVDILGAGLDTNDKDMQTEALGILKEAIKEFARLALIQSAIERAMN